MAETSGPVPTARRKSGRRKFTLAEASRRPSTAQRLQAGIQIHQEGRHAEAAEIYRQVLEVEPNHADALHLLGLAEADDNRADAGIALIRNAIALAPKTELYHLNLLLLLKSQGDFAGAEHTVKEMLQELPESAKGHAQLAIVQERRGAMAEAEQSRRRAIDLAPRAATHMGELAYMLELQNRLDEAAEWAHQGLAIEPENAVCRLVAAKGFRRDGQLAKALSLLAPTPKFRDSAFQFELGLLCDANQRHEEAFAHWKFANQLVSETYGASAKPDVFLNEVVALEQLYQAPIVENFTILSAQTERRRLFVTGFPRSGTSLMHHRLSQATGVLGRHEPLTMETVKVAMRQLPRGYPATIATMTDQEARVLREVYDQVFCVSHDRTAAESTPGDVAQGDVAQKVWMDTSPQHLVDLGLLFRLFPDANFVYVIRHPMDVVLSCFMQNFRYSNFTGNFGSVERAAETYHRMFSLWRNTVRQFQHRCRILRYEELIAAPEETLAELKEWLGWPGFADEQASATRAEDQAANGQTISRIATPSYHQVVQPIYRTAEGRWRNYESQMQGAAKILGPWIEYFGY